MSSLRDLPEEVLIIIIRELDTKSIYNLYNTCKYLRQIVCLHGVVKKIQFSLNTMATVNSLKLDFFKDISKHLWELNLCGVSDLKKSLLLPVMKRLKCLRTLDISYTNINMIDFLQMYQLCPTIKNISINFVFGAHGLVEITDDEVNICQDMFQHFDNVHFVGSMTNLLHSPLSQYVLNKSKLNCLKYSVSECNYTFTTNHRNLVNEETNIKAKFKQFILCILDWRDITKHLQKINTNPLLANLNFSKYEFIIITMLSIENFDILISPLFENFFKDYFDLKVHVVNECDKPLFGNIAIMVWDKSSNIFGDKFFRELYAILKNYFPVSCTPDQPPLTLNHDWFYSTPNIDLYNDIHKPRPLNRRIGMSSSCLNYDSVLKEKNKIMLSIIFHDQKKNVLKLCGDYLQKITFLNLSGSVRYNTDFFSILFSSCHSLITLSVEATSVSPCAAAISRAIHLSKSLENIRIVDKRIDFNSLFIALSKCTLISNINIVENTPVVPCTISNPNILIEQCNNLYNLYIEAPMTEKELTKNMRLLNKAKDKFKKHHVNVTLLQKSFDDKRRYYYDPYLEVFRLNPIKQI